MKFKAKLTPHQTNLLHNLILPISRLHPSSTSSSTSSPTSILYLDDDKLVLSTRGGSSYTTAANSKNAFASSSHYTSNTQSNNDAEGIFCFAELVTKQGIFKELVIESLEQDNAILMEVNLVQLRTALRGVLNAQTKHSGGGGGGSNTNNSFILGMRGTMNNNKRRQSSEMRFGGPDLTIKLAKRNGGLPHLCLDVKDGNSNAQSNNVSFSGTIGVHHAIPVRMMRVEELQYHVPPRLGMPDVQLALPKDRLLKPVVERLRTISPHVYIEGSMRGLLTLRIDGDGASIRTTFNKLIPIHEDCKTQNSQDENAPTNASQSQTQDFATCTVKVDSKKLHASLHWQGTLGMVKDITTAVLCLWENEMLVLDVTLNPDIGRFMYYVPVHYLSDDWT